MKKIYVLLIIVGTFLLYSSSITQAVPILYTDLPTWQAAVTGSQVLTTISANVALSDEVASPPGANNGVGNTLTFQTINTGLSRGFKVQTLQIGATFTFDDHESGNLPNYDNALSVGDIHNHEDDDWRLTLLDNATMTAFGINIRDNAFEAGEYISLYSGNTLIHTFDLAFLGASTINSIFIGVTAELAFDRIDFNEHSGGDDMAIADFRFAENPNAVPEPATIALLGIGLAGLAGAAARRRLNHKIRNNNLSAKGGQGNSKQIQNQKLGSG